MCIYIYIYTYIYIYIHTHNLAVHDALRRADLEVARDARGDAVQDLGNALKSCLEYY